VAVATQATVAALHSLKVRSCSNARIKRSPSRVGHNDTLSEFAPPYPMSGHLAKSVWGTDLPLRAFLACSYNLIRQGTEYAV